MSNSEGERLAHALSEARMSKEELAVALRIGVKTIERWINNKYAIPLKYMAEIEHHTGRSGMWIKTGTWQRDQKAGNVAPVITENRENSIGDATIANQILKKLGNHSSNDTEGSEIPLSVPFKIGDQVAFYLDLTVRVKIRPANHTGINISLPKEAPVQSK